MLQDLDAINNIKKQNMPRHRSTKFSPVALLLTIEPVAKGKTQAESHTAVRNRKRSQSQEQQTATDQIAVK
jgi:hypothetical protein